MRFAIFTCLLLLCCGIYSQDYQHDSVQYKEGYLHYYVKGDGPPVLLIPGGMGFSSYYMRGISDSITNHTSILIDLYGTGRSQYRPPDTSWVNQYNAVKDIEHLRKHLKIDQWTVIGQSWSTHTALLYGLLHPNRTTKVILQACAGTNNSFQAYYGDNIRMRYTDQDKTEIERLKKDPDRERFAIFKIRFRAYFYNPDLSWKFFEMPENEKPYFYNGSFFKAFVNEPGYSTFSLEDKVATMDVPVVIIQGRQDPLTSEIQERLNSRIKNSEIFYIEKAGHFPWLEQPDSFFNILRKSLK